MGAGKNARKKIGTWGDYHTSRKGRAPIHGRGMAFGGSSIMLSASRARGRHSGSRSASTRFARYINGLANSNKRSFSHNFHYGKCVSLQYQALSAFYHHDPRPAHGSPGSGGLENRAKSRSRPGLCRFTPPNSRTRHARIKPAHLLSISAILFCSRHFGGAVKLQPHLYGKTTSVIFFILRFQCLSFKSTQALSKITQGRSGIWCLFSST